MRSYEKAGTKVSFTEQSPIINYDPENLLTLWLEVKTEILQVTGIGDRRTVTLVQLQTCTGGGLAWII